ncbi:MAG: Crp/Fnr family transcriptional regulator [bacterium]|nr:Crp/Fnr family transcriptional regulator [bacterium]
MKSILEEIAPYLTEEEIDQFASLASSKHYKKKQKIVRAGDFSQNVFLVKDAMVRGFLITEEGEEKTIILRPPKTFIGSPSNLFQGKAARFSFETLDDSEVYFVNFDKVLALSADYPGMTKLLIEVFAETIQTLLWRIESLTYKLPETRYEELIEERPQFFQMAYHKHIANFLGVSATSLSRIIKRKMDKS